MSLLASVLTVAGGVALTGTIGADSLVLAGTLALVGNAGLDVGTAMVTAGAVLVQGGGAALSVAGTLTLMGDLAATGGGGVAAGGLVLAGGTLDVDSTSAIGIGGAGDLGAVALAAGATLSGYGRVDAALEAWGSIVVQGGALALFGTVTGEGVFTLASFGTLYAPGGLSPSLPVGFAGPNATLDLTSLAQGVVQPITGFALSDGIAVLGAVVTGAAWQDGTLTLTAADGSTAALPMPGGYTGQSFVALPDGAGGSVVKLASVTIAGLAASDIGLGDGGDLVELLGTSSADRLTIDAPVVLGGTAVIGTLALRGTLVAAGAASLTVSDIAGSGGLAVEGGASAEILSATALAATLDAIGGGRVVLDAATLAGGALLADAASWLAIGGTAAAAGTILVAPGATLAGFGRIAAPADVEGGVSAQGGVLVVAATLSGGGRVAIGSGATLADFAPLALPVSFAPDAVLQLDSAGFAGTLEGFAASDAIDLPGWTLDSAVWTPGTLSLLDGGATLATLAVDGDYTGQVWQAGPDGAGGSRVQLAAPAATRLIVDSAMAVAGSLSADTLEVDSGAVLTLAQATLAAGSLIVGAGATVTGAGVLTGSARVDGLLTAQGGMLTAKGSIAGTGTVAIGGGACLYAPLGIGAAITVAFTGDGGTLELFAPSLATGATITGLAAHPGAARGNVIDLAGAGLVQASYTDLGGGSGFLGIASGGDALGTLALSGIAARPSVLVQPDGTGGSRIELVPCFAAGTRIATPDGEMPVERLAPGDAVFTATGPRRLCWTAARHADSTGAPELRPVRIAAGALGAGLPWRDLLVSPRHALLLGGRLVPAVALADGGRIRREPPGAVAYHHLGLAAHGTVWAEGVAAETFRPDGTAVRFDRESGLRPLPGPPCAPVIEDGLALERLRRRLLGPPPPRAAPPGPLRGHVERVVRHGPCWRLEGWAHDPAAPGRPVVLLAVRRERAMLPVIANQWRPDLDRAGLADGRCGFAVDIPAAGGPVRLWRPADGIWLPGASGPEPDGSSGYPDN